VAQARTRWKRIRGRKSRQNRASCKGIKKKFAEEAGRERGGYSKKAAVDGKKKDAHAKLSSSPRTGDRNRQGVGRRIIS